MMPSEAGATRTGPSATGRFEKNDGNGNSSCVHDDAGGRRNTSDSPSVMISTSQWVAPTARRITRRSTPKRQQPPPARTAARSATTSGRPSARWALQATNVETMSISPWAKFRVRVAL